MWAVAFLNLRFRDALELLLVQLALAVVTWLASLLGADLPPPVRTARVWLEA